MRVRQFAVPQAPQAQPELQFPQGQPGAWMLEAAVATAGVARAATALVALGRSASPALGAKASVVDAKPPKARAQV